MTSDLPIAIPPKYVAEVRSFQKTGDSVRTFDLRGNTAREIISQFESLRLAELEGGYEAYLPNELYYASLLTFAGEDQT